jgi:hypothetical protein
MWSFKKEIILTKNNYQREIEVNTTYYFCSKLKIQHLLFVCTYDRSLWRKFCMVLGINPPLSVKSYFYDWYRARDKYFRSFLLTVAVVIC